MAKKSTSQGIGYINSRNEYIALVNKVNDIIIGAFQREDSTPSGIQNAINKIKEKIDALVGRTRQDYTKTDIYQVAFCIFHDAVLEYQESIRRNMTDAQVNTVVAKLMTEGQYGNPSVVRRQTTREKLRELRNRIFPGEVLYLPKLTWNNFITTTEKEQLKKIAGKMLQRSTRSTVTTRVSNRTRRTTTPRATTTPSTPAPSRPSSIASYPGQVHTENEFNELVTYINSINATTTEERKKKIFLCIPLFKYLLKQRFDAIPRSTYGLPTLTNSQMGNIFQSLYQKVNNLDLWISFAFLLYGFRTVNTKRVISPLINLLPTNQRSMAGLSAISKKFGMGDRTFVKKMLAHLHNDRTSTGPSRVVSYMVNGSDAGRSPFSNFIGGAYKADEGYLAFRLLKPNFVSSYEADATPSATVTDRTPPGFGPDVTQESFRQTQATPTPTPTPPAPAPPPPVDTLIRNMKITDEFDFGVEWEHFGLGLPKIKRAMQKIGQPLYPEYVPYHDFDSYDRAIKPGMFPNNKVNKGWWVLQIDGSVRRDRSEPNSEFRNTKQEAIISQRGRSYDTYEGEFVSPVLGGKRGLAIIKLVGNTLVNEGMRHNKTMGMHTHVTKKGFTRTNIKNLMYNYIAMEPLIESMMEPNRRSTSPSQYNTSHFIQLRLSLSSTESQVKDVLKQKILDVSDDTFYYNFGQRKQQAVNLKPFYGGNTIEFRQQGANFEADSVTMWIAFLFYFCQFSKKKRFTGFQWNNLIAIMPVGLASFWYNRIQDLTGKSPYELSFRK